MRPSARRLRIAAPVLLASLALSACAAKPNYPEVEKYIVDCERQWAESVYTGDTAAIERILADDFVGVDPDGRSYDKARMVSHDSVEATSVSGWFAKRVSPKYPDSTDRRAPGSRGSLPPDTAHCRCAGSWP